MALVPDPLSSAGRLRAGEGEPVPPRGSDRQVFFYETHSGRFTIRPAPRPAHGGTCADAPRTGAPKGGGRNIDAVTARQ